jgi:hypothetical protein
MRRLDTTDAGACWEWPGANVPKGYGVVQMGKGIGNRYVHRVTYEHFIGPIADGMHIDHLCRNPPCCNPHHLEAVTVRENILRGQGSGAESIRRGTCINGHLYTLENTYVYDGSRQCKTCRNHHRAAHRARQGGDAFSTSPTHADQQ